MLDPLLCDNGRPRLCMFPIENQQAFDAYKRAQACYWSTDEVDFTEDRRDYDGLSEAEKEFLNNVLGFFAASDSLVNENLMTNFMSEVVQPEVKAFYSFQAAIEAVHQETYSLLIDTLISNETKKSQLFNAVIEMPSVKAKADFVQKYMDPETNSFAERLIAFATIEGILFSSSFASIFHFKKLNKMPGLCFSNELISRDEGLHTNFAVLIHSQIRDKASSERITEIVRQAVEVETIFVNAALRQPLIGMNAPDMVQYVQFVADRLLVDLGINKTFNVRNPFKWMTNQSLTGKTNFFEKKVSEYSKCRVGNSVEENSFTLDYAF